MIKFPALLLLFSLCISRHGFAEDTMADMFSKTETPKKMYGGLILGPTRGISPSTDAQLWYGMEFGYQKVNTAIIATYKHDWLWLTFFPRFMHDFKPFGNLVISIFGGLTLDLVFADNVATQTSIGAGSRLTYFFGDKIGIFIEPTTFHFSFIHYSLEWQWHHYLYYRGLAGVTLKF